MYQCVICWKQICSLVLCAPTAIDRHFQGKRILEHGFYVVAFLKLNIWLPPWILLLVQSFPCLLCPIMLPYTSFFLLLRSWRGKLLSVSRILNTQISAPSLLDLSVLKMILLLDMDFHRDLRAPSCHCLRGTWGRALCFLDFALKSAWVVDKWRFWDPSLQAPELTGTVRFYRVLLQSPGNLHLPWFSSISPSLVQVSLQKWSHRVPQDQQLQISGWMAAELSGLLFFQVL